MEKRILGTNDVTKLRPLWLTRNTFSPGLCDTGALRIQAGPQQRACRGGLRPLEGAAALLLRSPEKPAVS